MQLKSGWKDMCSGRHIITMWFCEDAGYVDFSHIAWMKVQLSGKLSAENDVKFLQKFPNDFEILNRYM